MQKSLLFIFIAMLCSLMSIAQSGLVQPKNILGSSIVCNTEYIPGTTMDLSFNMIVNSQDGEWIDYVDLTLPAGFTINSVTSPLPGLAQPVNSISGNTVSWGQNINDGGASINYQIPFTGSNSFNNGGQNKLCSHWGCNAGYDNGANGYTIIYPDSLNAINITGSFDIESGYDYINIYYGEGLVGTPVVYNGSGSINFTGNPGEAVTVQFTSDGSITMTGFSLIVSSGVQPYNFTVNVTIENTVSGDQIIPWNISGNMYGNSPSDASGNITLKRIPFVFDITTVYPTCGLSDGSISVAVLSGGTAPYTFQWDDISGSTTSLINGLDVRTYKVVATDFIGLKDSVEIELFNSAGPLSDFTIIKQPCPGFSDGSLAVSASGAGPFSYIWSTGSINDTLFNLVSGNYRVTVTDESNNCKNIKSIFLDVFSGMTTSMNNIDRLCSYSTSGGMASVSVTGGIPPYSYFWSNQGGTLSENTSPVIGLNYVTVTDANGCFVSDAISVGLPLPIQFLSDVYNVNCYGENNGEVDIYISGGTPGYSYIWSVASFNDYIYPVGPGTYSVTVTDANNCIDSASFIITEPPLFTAQVNAYSASCGSNNGAAVVTVSGGLTPYVYYWDDPANSTTDSISGLAVGVYHSSVYDYNGCNVTNQVVVSNSGGPVDTVYTVDVTCGSLNNGKAWVYVSSGIPPYTYLWSNNISVTDTAYNYYSGMNSVTVTDINGCSTVTAFEIKEPVLTITKINPTCQNNWDGSISVNISGGTPPYTYSWYGPVNGTEQTLSYVPAGGYSVTVYDSQGCYWYGYENLTAPQGPAVNFSTVNNPTCYGFADGSVLVSVAGGTQPLQYYWYNDNNYTIEGYTKDMLNLPAGPYYYEVSDSLGCYYSFGPATLTDPLQISISFNTVNPDCGNNNGTVEAIANNGVAPYSYLWNNNVSANIINNLNTGIYTVIATDANGCFYRDSAIIESYNFGFMETVTPVTCYGGSDGAILLDDGGGYKMLYNFQWSSGATGFNPTGLYGGNHSVTITDNTGCAEVLIINVPQPDEILINFDFGNVTCHGESSGYIDIWDIWGGNVNGGMGTNGGAKWNLNNGHPHPKYISDYSIEWYFEGELYSTDAYIYDLPIGVYTAVITDYIGCSKSFNFTITEPSLYYASVVTPISCHSLSDGVIEINATTEVGTLTYSIDDGITFQNSNIFDSLPLGMYDIYTQVNGDYTCQQFQGTLQITEPDTLVGTVTTTPVLCHGGNTGTITVAGAGGTTPYSYSVNGGSYQETTLFNNIPAGTYTVTVSDNKGCTYDIAGGITVTEIPQLTVTLAITPVSCFSGNNGAITSTVSGGTAPYTYLWSNDSTTSSISGLSAASYSVVVEDVNNCLFVKTATVTEPIAVSASVAGTNVTCNGNNDGSAAVSAVGGNNTFTYNWSTGGTSNIEIGLGVSTYSVTVFDGNNCSDTATVTITEPTAISVTLSGNDILCFGAATGSANAVAAGGVGQYQYLWSTNATTNSINNLTAATYTVTVKDNNNCSASVSIILTEPTALSVIGNGTDAYCNGSSTGSASATVNGSTAPYTYYWSNDSLGSSVTGLIAGIYTVTVKDLNNCSATDTVVISQAIPITVAVSGTNLTCNAGGDGTASVVATGGNGIYTYLWSNSDVTSVVTGLSAITYTVTVTDGNNCTETGAITLTEPLAITVTVTGVNATCNGGNDGTASTTATGGNGLYTFAWSNSATTNSITGLSAGLYSVTVTDSNSCLGTGSITITQPAVLTATATATNVLCNGDNNNGTITVVGSGGVAPYLYTVNANSQSTSLFSGLAIGTYAVSVTDVNGCNYLVPGGVSISQPAILNAVLTSTPVSCFSGNNGTITTAVSGGVAPFNYLWSNDATTSSISGLTAASYSVVVRDQNNCIVLKATNVTEPSILEIGLTSTNVMCNGTSTGTADVVASGGVGSYTYLWSNGATISSVNGLTVGTYTITVKDGNNCSVSDLVTLSEPNVLSVSLSATVSACNICSGTATVTVTGGTIPYSYNWSNTDAYPTADSLCAGTADVTVTDFNGCTAAGNTFITSQALSNISGEAHWSGGLLPDNSANVEFYKILNLTQAELTYTIPLVGSQFAISNIAYGQYFLKVNITDGTNLPNVLSTYLDSIHLWEYADTLLIACASNYDLHVPMYETTQPAGAPVGTISGFLTYYDGGAKGISATEGINLAGEPVPGAEIYVELEPDDEPIINTTTNDTGFYFVSGLESGNTYTISVDIPGLPMISTYSHISINGDSMVYNHLNFYVDTSETHGGIFINPTDIVVKHENELFKLEMYPNPFNEYLNIDYNLNKYGRVSLDIYDISGKVITTLVNENQAEGLYNYVFNAHEINLAEGTYIVKLQVDNTVFIKKILQIK